MGLIVAKGTIGAYDYLQSLFGLDYFAEYIRIVSANLFACMPNLHCNLQCNRCVNLRCEMVNKAFAQELIDVRWDTGFSGITEGHGEEG